MENTEEKEYEDSEGKDKFNLEFQQRTQANKEADEKRTQVEQEKIVDLISERLTLTNWK